MGIRERAAEVIDAHEWSRLGGSRGEQIADKLAAEGLLNMHEMYAAIGELHPEDRIILNDAKTGPSVYRVTQQYVDPVTGDSHVYGIKDRLQREPHLVLVGPANMHVRKAVE